MAPRRFFALFAALCLLGRPGGSATAGADAPPPWAAWQAGDSWTVSVELFGADPDGAPQDPPKVTARYNLQVKVVATEPVGGTACWRVDFTPAKEAPAAVGDPYRTWIARDSGWPVKVARAGGPASASVVSFEKGVSILAGSPEGVPVEFFPLPDAQGLHANSAADALTVKVQEDANKTRTAEATLKTAAGEVVVRQKWPAGARWWREYERRVNGRKDLHARFLVASRPDPVAAKPPEEPHDLRKDPKLQATVTVLEDNPPLEEVLQRVREATGLSLTVDPALAKHDPKLGGVRFNAAPAWMVLNLVAETQLVDGHWESVEGGYRLTAQASLREGESPVPSWRRPLAVSAGGLALLLGGVAVVLFLRRDRATPKPVPPVATGPQAPR
jgi:hypothetical protein